jgi:PAS domain S-box-containing protein
MKMKKRFWILSLIALVGLCSLLYEVFYNEAKKRAIQSLNTQQRLHAKQAALGIEDYLDHMTKSLEVISRSRGSAPFDRSGREMMEAFYETNKGKIETCIRVDRGGRIIYSIPHREAIGSDISGQKHIREIMSSHKPVVSDVFKAVQGFDVIALHVPVFNKGKYDGTIGIGIHFQAIAQRYLEGIQIGQTGYAWMISRDGTELYCPVPGHMGRTVFENCKEFPSILLMAKEMMEGHEGVTTYVFDRVRGQDAEGVKKHAVYMPIRVGNTFWSIVVASSEEEVLSSLVSFRNRLWLIIGLILLAGGLFSYYGLKAVFIVKEEETRRRAGEALRESEERYRLLFEGITDAVAVHGVLEGGIPGPFLAVNHVACERLGYTREELLRLSPRDIDAPESTTDWKSVVEDLRQGRRVLFEQLHVTKDGRRIPVEINSQPVEMQDHPVILSVVRDITERRRAEEIIQASEAKFRNIVNASPMGMHLYELKEGDRLVFIGANPAADRILGLDHTKFVGKTIEEAFPGLIRTEIPVRYREAARHGTMWRIEQLDYSEGPIAGSFEVVAFQTEPDKMVALFNDITDRKRAEEALHRSEEQARQLAEENAIMAEIGRIISSTLYIDEVYERFAEEVFKLIPFDRINVNLIDDENQTLTSAYSTGRSVKGREIGEVFPLRGSAAAEVMRTRSGLLLDASDETELKERFPGVLPSFQAGHRSMMIVPLISKDEVIGSLSFGSTRTKAFSDRDLKLAESIGAQIAGAIASAQLFIERRQMEEALRRSEERFRDLYDHAPVSYHEYDLEGRITRVNRTELEMLGYTLEEMVGQPIWKFNADEEMARRRVLGKLVGEVPASRGYELTYRRKDGTTLSLLAEDRVIRDSEGRVTGMRAIILDITERKRAEEALREQFHFLQQLLDAIPVPVFFKDRQGAFRGCNVAYERFLGMTKDQIVGKTVFGVAPQDLADIYHHADEALFAQPGTQVYEASFLHADGDRHDIIFNKATYVGTDGCVAGLVGVILDITERKRIEAALRKSEERFRELYDHAPLGYHEYDSEGRITRVNRTDVEMLGYTAEEMIGQYVWKFNVEEETVRQQVLAKLAGTLPLVRNLDRTYRRKDGTTFPVLCQDRLILDEHGQIRGMRSTVQDVTELKRVEEERRRLEERLSRAEKMEALGTLAGGVAHDLNNVLGVLVGYSELLLMEIPEGNPLRKHVSNILQSGQRGAAIIQDLLTLARRGVTVSEVVNLNQVISDYLKAPEFEKLKAYHPLVTFRSNLDKDLMNLKGSPVHLGKTVMNLLSNAAEAISGRGQVSVVTENHYLDKPVSGYDAIREGDYVVLRVSDNGKGIPKEEIGKIFEPFYTKKMMGRSGTGLGLAIVWGTVRDHGGYIDVQSEEGKGSTFTLYFPITREERVKNEASVLPGSYQGKGESILVVDDVKEQRELATAMLSGLGYRVSAVSSGEEAAAYLQSNRVNLLVLDMIMEPGMDGLETYQKVLEINPRQKAIIVSGFSETERVKKAQELGAGAYVRKPYIREKIGLAVRRELDK